MRKIDYARGWSESLTNEPEVNIGVLHSTTIYFLFRVKNIVFNERDVGGQQDPT